eukprot:3392683-Pleurochrysis_carterae.AAC.1
MRRSDPRMPSNARNLLGKVCSASISTRRPLAGRSRLAPTRLTAARVLARANAASSARAPARAPAPARARVRAPVPLASPLQSRLG